MENKYYTPNLEEFCSGFEYEEWVESYPEGFWTSTYVYGEASHSTPSLQSLRNLIKTENIRTKFLDQSDIESFGFFGIMSGVFGRQIVNNLQFVKPISDNEWCSIDAKLIEHNRHPIESIVITKTINEKTSIIFDGVIKNRNEFKRILKQLNIIE